MKILLVEDSDRLRGLMAEALGRAGYTVDVVSTVADLLDHAPVTACDLVIVDLGLPDGDGLDAIRELRRRKFQAPILIVTARSSIDERVTGLDAGGDDYLIKPFNNAELLARVRALMRRPPDVRSSVHVVGNVAVDDNLAHVTCADKIIDLRPSERRLLWLLIRRPRTVVARGMIEDALADPGRETTPNAIEAVVSRLRKALAEAGADVEIQTVRSIGYVLREKTE